MWVEIGPDHEDSLMAAGVLGEWDLGDRKAVGKAIEGHLDFLQMKSGPGPCPRRSPVECSPEWIGVITRHAGDEHTP